MRKVQSLEKHHEAKRLINPANPPHDRIDGWGILSQCAKNDLASDLERRGYFETLTGPVHPDDFYLQLAVLEDLTQHGRNVDWICYDIFPLLTTWLQGNYANVKTVRKNAPRSLKGKAAVNGVEKTFSQLFAYIKDLIKFNFKFASDSVIGKLLNGLLRICMDTCVEEDLRACISVLDTLVTFGAIPNENLKSCVYVLGSIHCLVPAMQMDAWHVLGRVCKSHHGQSTVRVLLDALRPPPVPALRSSPVPADKEKVEMSAQTEVPGSECSGSNGAESKEEGSTGKSTDQVAKREKNAVRDVRGALSVLKKILSKMGEKGYPSVPLFLLVEGLESISKRTGSSKVLTAVLRLVNSLLDGPNGRVNPIIAEEQWGPLFSIAVLCVQKESARTGARAAVHGQTTNSTSALADQGEDTTPYQLTCLISRVEGLLRQQGPDRLQRDECLRFLTQLHSNLPDSAVELVLSHFKEYRSCLPSDPEWESNLHVVLEGVFLDRRRRTLTRIQALETCVQVYDFVGLVRDQAASDIVDDLDGSKEADSPVASKEAHGLALSGIVDNLVRRLVTELDREKETLVLQELTTFLVKVSEESSLEIFDCIMDALRGVVHAERARSATSPPIAPLTSPTTPAQLGLYTDQSLTAVVTRGYAQIFMRTLAKAAFKAARAFNALVHIAKSNGYESDARLAAMKVLFHLRADHENRMFLATSSASDALAQTLLRTEASFARKLADDAAVLSRPSKTEQTGASASRQSRGVSFTQTQPGDRSLSLRALNSGKAFSTGSHRLWSLPDADSLPERPPSHPSRVLFSYQDEIAMGQDDGNDGKKILDMGSWLAAVTSLLHKGCDWEVYSFILVHLPAQLSNHTVFRNSVAQIQELRRKICEMIRINHVQEPPHASGLRRSDVANCLFYSLTMILSYHQFFQKNDEDEMVRTFMQGISDKTAKTCIHALSVCCHELPLSTSKSLVTILQKMSQVITQPFVAMHILEFLACLGRLHGLYSNFREDEFRIVFGICVRYLQYVRDKKRPSRTSHYSEPPTPVGGIADAGSQQASADDLPQYVYALAYHVITFWFLAVKVPDRPNHIAWIAKNLFTDVDGTPTNEEQAQITIDFMQRVAYSNVNDSLPDPLFKEEFYGEILKKSWIIGSSIVTIKQAKESAWAEVTRRSASGMSVFSVQSKITPVPAHQVTDGSDIGTRDGQNCVENTIYPSNLLLQLFAPVPQVLDPMSRPVPLPDDAAVDRAIRLFDHNSTVDGHKIGVTYIGEGQTKEAEILANRVGSPDYHDFLRGLGTLTRLKGATINTQGLDREYDSDGLYTFCWRDRVTEIVFHVTTQMPTNMERDPQCIGKKRHIGNDFVNIIFNDSGHVFEFDTFPSEFNYVNIVITPSPRHSFVAARKAAKSQQGGEEEVPLAFFTVQVMSKPGFPEISPAAEPKLVSLKALPGFVRLLGLNASVFSHVWANREGGEYISSWRNRLREINRLRERYGPKVVLGPCPPLNGTGAPVPGLGAGASAATGYGGAQGQGQAGQQQAAGTMDPLKGPPGSARDSISSMRRSSVATYYTTGSTDPSTNRSSILSTTTTENTEIKPMTSAENLVDTVDFSRWA